MNKGHSNLAKGDIAHGMQKKSCRYLLSYTPSDSTRSEVGPVRGVFWLHILGEGGGLRGQRWYHSKER